MNVTSRSSRPPPSIHIIQDTPEQTSTHSSTSFPKNHSYPFTTSPITSPQIRNESSVIPTPGMVANISRGVDLAWDIKLQEHPRRESSKNSPIWNHESLKQRCVNDSGDLNCSFLTSAPRSPARAPNSNPYTIISEEYIGANCYNQNVLSKRSRDAEMTRSTALNCPRFQVHDKYQSISQDYDKVMLSKLDSRVKTERKTPPLGQVRPLFRLSHGEFISQFYHDPHGQLKPLSVPNQSARVPTVDSSLNKYPEIIAPDSPHNPNPGQIYHRSPTDVIDSERLSVSSHLRQSSSGFLFGNDLLSISSRLSDSPDNRKDSECNFEHQDETRFRQLNINESSIRSDYKLPGISCGKKRRASSPPDDNVISAQLVTATSDLYRRRESTASRSSADPRFHSQSGSVSSTGSGSRTYSQTSNLSVATSNLTNNTSIGRLSPGGNSPGSLDGIDSPEATSISSNPSPRGSISRLNQLENIQSEARTFVQPSRHFPDSAGFARHTCPLSILQGIFVCECCPKKPKKFDTQEGLNAHEQEKQYECAYCRNRFKNKNEAERHQNSLHLRRHSWSCAALSGYAAAFHNSPSRPNEADACGYCGEEFSRSGIATGVPFPTEKDWDIRINHLRDMHKFGECNHAKKFFRADHFRQHLKHSHAGTSGKWTNMLENACIKDEPLPEPIRATGRNSPNGSQVA